jgi:O-acetylhomoserine/O-acetylserine sulfhydrylase-like pyridoxal-dependent enzyme
LEKKIAALEEAKYGVAFASGMAALNAVVTACCSSGDNVIAGANMYDGAIAYFDDVAPRQGITVTWVDVLDPAAVKAAVRLNSKVRTPPSFLNHGTPDT